MPDHGMIHRKSDHTVVQTLVKLESILSAKGIPVLARIDHAAAAELVGLKMQRATLVVFGNAKAGTPLMVAAPTAALDLPLKVLVWEDGDGVVWVTYSSPAYLRDRHGFPDELIANIDGIRVIVDGAASS